LASRNLPCLTGSPVDIRVGNPSASVTLNGSNCSTDSSTRIGVFGDVAFKRMTEDVLQRRLEVRGNIILRMSEAGAGKRASNGRIVRMVRHHMGRFAAVGLASAGTAFPERLGRVGSLPDYGTRGRRVKPETARQNIDSPTPNATRQ